MVLEPQIAACVAVEPSKQPDVPSLVSLVTVVAALATVSMWVLTAQELNRLTAYRAVGDEALRIASAAAAQPNGERVKEAQFASAPPCTRWADC